MVPEKSLLEFIFEILEKSPQKVFYSLDIKGFPLQKEIKSVQKHFYIKKSYFYLFRLSLYMFLAFF